MRLLSADSHVIEPPTLWQNYVDPAFRDRSPRLERRDDTDVLVCDGVEFPPLALYAGCLRRDDDVRTSGRWDEDIPAAAYDPAIRRKAVEADGISGEVLFPTVAMSFYALDDPATPRALRGLQPLDRRVLRERSQLLQGPRRARRRRRRRRGR